MKKKQLLLAIILSAFFSGAFAQSDQEQRIQASYMLAFGRPANSGELTYWKGQGNKSIADLLANHRKYLNQDPVEANRTISRTYVDAFGRRPSNDEIVYWSRYPSVYTELMKNHLKYLQDNPGEYSKVIDRSYQWVFKRKPNAGELTYWQGQPKVTYLLLVGYHQDYQKKNQTSKAGSMNMSNAPAISTVPLSSGIAAEAAKAAGLASGVIAAGGGNVVAAGGGNVVAAGGMNVIAPGGGN